MSENKKIPCPVCGAIMKYDERVVSYSTDDELGRSTTNLFDGYSCPDGHLIAMDWLEDEGSDYYERASFVGQIEFYDWKADKGHGRIEYDPMRWRVEHPEW